MVGGTTTGQATGVVLLSGAVAGRGRTGRRRHRVGAPDTSNGGIRLVRPFCHAGGYRGQGRGHGHDNREIQLRFRHVRRSQFRGTRPLRRDVVDPAVPPSQPEGPGVRRGGAGALARMVSSGTLQRGSGPRRFPDRYLRHCALWDSGVVAGP